MINETRLSFTELGESLAKPTPAQLSEWRKISIMDWAIESQQYRPQVYQFKGTKLGYEYGYYNMPLVRLRLLQSGVRIAEVLNDIYG